MSYQDWHNGGVLCAVPSEILDELKSFYYVFTKNRMPQLWNNKGTYKQWNVQTTTSSNKNDESCYVNWIDENNLTLTKKFFSNYVSNISTFRYSLLSKSTDVNWHPAHLLPRIHIPLNESVSQMVIRENEQNNYIQFEYGNAYYTNVTKLHKIVGDLNNVRQNAFFCFTDFVDETLKSKYTYSMPT